MTARPRRGGKWICKSVLDAIAGDDDDGTSASPANPGRRLSAEERAAVERQMRAEGKL